MRASSSRIGKPDSIKFAVIGDTGTGDQHQRDVAKQLAERRAQFPFEFVIMMGDNLYGSENPRDFARKFEEPYAPLLKAGVKFYAALGNHDDPNQRFYKPFNMNGERYYSFKPSLTGGVRFFALDSNYMDKRQLDWLEKELAASGSDWKICFFHHPPYSSGETHGSSVVIREQLEPLFLKHGVDRRVHRARALLRAHQAAEGHHLLHPGELGEAAEGGSRANRADREGIRLGIHVHAGGHQGTTSCRSRPSRRRVRSSTRVPRVASR